ncbi:MULTISPECIES: Cof-type HAD-IIB family hydrolase [Bacillaceae]|uniref:Cof-type HAD-IIB family hydrolase n=1 Tax=Bacillaceae TaxID=186817 RepID=UPI000C77075E|nr:MULTISPECIES: Cof-type HAD-IIB family hydrolase [Bacillaceae]PLR67476.1 phosphoglycolate phosphatase [Bacillus sp. UMB0893]QNG59765.1 HAD family phosphatase [Bacillus sp. PAMC26568]
MDIKLIALDMDGTLLNEEKEISAANRQAIKDAEAKGIHVVISTGRSMATLRDLAKSLSLSSYLVTVNGSEIWDEHGELVERNIVHNDLMTWMYDLSKTHKTGYWATSTERVFFDEMPEDLSAYQWLKFGYEIKDDKVRETILNELRSREAFEITNSSPTNIEVNAIGINKAKGIEKVCSLLSISMENVMACGDSMNDIAMIKEAGLGIAMGNAQDIVKEAADWVTASNDEDGVAAAIKKWVL